MLLAKLDLATEGSFGGGLGVGGTTSTVIGDGTSRSLSGSNAKSGSKSRSRVGIGSVGNPGLEATFGTGLSSGRTSTASLRETTVTSSR